MELERGRGRRLLGTTGAGEAGQDQADDERMIAWTSRAVQQMEPWTIGQYIGDSDFGRRPMKFMSDDHFARLQGIARTWDPDSAFVGYLTDDAGHANVNPWESA